jgi:hypothetical protein
MESYLFDASKIIRPDYYKIGEIETIDIIKDCVDDFNSFLEGNLFKYLRRYKQKGGVYDLYKLSYYLNLLIENIESGGPLGED